MAKLQIIYTGGTIGMMHDTSSGSLKPFDFGQLYEQIPELKRLRHELDFHSMEPLIDSSNMEPFRWQEIAAFIHTNYEKYDGFVILHGTDTMSYTASALSFMLENLAKPVILTGSQLPIGEIRTDAKENIITAIEMAATQVNSSPRIQEVCVYFDYKLLRGNRTRKSNASQFKAFESPNYPPLAEAGVHIDWLQANTGKGHASSLSVNTSINKNVALLKLYPGISEQFLSAILNTADLKALVLETFGSGNAPNFPWFIDALKEAISKGLIIYNVTQCGEGMVEQNVYETGSALARIGVIPGADITTEAAITKLMSLLGQNLSSTKIKELLQKSLRGEMSV